MHILYSIFCSVQFKNKNKKGTFKEVFPELGVLFEGQGPLLASKVKNSRSIQFAVVQLDYVCKVIKIVSWYSQTLFVSTSTLSAIIPIYNALQG